MHPKNEQGGELVVIGCNKVQIHLKDYPHRVEVFFKKKHSPPPCDPHHCHTADSLKWDIHRVHHGHGHHHIYTLNIEWDVHEIREIIWLVYY